MRTKPKIPRPNHSHQPPTWPRRSPAPSYHEPMAPVIRAPRGTSLRCRGWKRVGALRRLMNTLAPAVAERAADLVVNGGTGKAARDWPSFLAIVRERRSLANDE